MPKKKKKLLLLYSHMRYHNDTIIKTQEDFFRKYTSRFICKVWKGCVGCYCERELETEQKLQYFDPHSYGRQQCVFLILQGCSTGGPEAHSAGWWLSLLHLISNFSGPQLIRAPRPQGLMWLSLPHLVYNSVSNSNCNSDFCLDWVI